MNFIEIDWKTRKEIVPYITKDHPTLFNNECIHSFPQCHDVKSNLPTDELILQMGMVTSKSQLKRLYKQGAVQITITAQRKTIRIDQRRLDIWN